jgi:SAM dependent carboxyl methyltransferase
MKGYNQYSDNQRVLLLSRLSVAEEHLKLALGLTDKVLQVVDYGSSEGMNSMIFFKGVLERFRAYSNREVFITHTDVPDNGWNVLYNLVNTSENSYLKIPGVYYSTIGKTFYSQLFPSQSVHIGFSSNAFHWLSKPVKRIYEEEKTLQAKQDAKTILSHRIQELVIGGTLIFSVAGKTQGLSASVSSKVYNQAFSSLVEKGIISKEESENFEINVHFMSIFDWTEVLSEFKAQIEVVKIENQKSLSFHYSEYLKDQDLEKYKAKFSSSISSILKTYFLQYFNRPKDENEKIFESFVEELKLAIEDYKEEQSFNNLITIIIKRLN